MQNAEAQKRLFGTDGIRGVAGEYPLDRGTIERLSAAVVRVLPKRQTAPRVLVGRDTRESGEWIEAALTSGASGQGAVVTSAGVVPTPAVAYLTRAEGFDVGVVVSASHNPFEDNGIKVFSGRGEKFTERVEREMEEMFSDTSWSARGGNVVPISGANLVDKYLAHLRTILPEGTRQSGFKIGVDCANGAMTSVAPGLFAGLGFDVTAIGASPNGRNINLGCGSTHPEELAAVVVRDGCQMGVAFDGDGDRAIFVDERGRVVNGDVVLFMCALQLQREGRLTGNAVVATVMSNVGLELALKQHGIGLVRCAVGDEYVMEEMLARNIVLGGEQSGHIIFTDYLFTGDGLCTALNVLRTTTLTGRTLGALSDDLITYPQVLLNVRVNERVDLSSVPEIAATIARVETRLAGQGRLLVRYSGTEPLLRVMIEGQNETDIRIWAQEIVDAATPFIGE